MNEFWKMSNKLESEGAFGYRTSNKDFNKKIITPWEKIKPKYHDFKDIYPEKDINKDQARIKQKKNSPDWIKEKCEESIAIEYIIAEGIGGYDWLGPDTQISLTHEYDDIENGVDLVASFYDEETKETIVMGIDATVSEDQGELKKKFNRLLDNCRHGILKKVKYHIPDNPDEKKGKRRLPVVVFAANKQSVKKLITEFADKDENIVNNEMQLEVLEEFEAQLSYLLYVVCRHAIPLKPKSTKDISLFIEKNKINLKNSESYFTINHYKKLLKIIGQIKNKKSSLGKVNPERAQEESFQLLTHPEDHFQDDRWGE